MSVRKTEAIMRKGRREMKKILTGLLALLLITQSAYAESPSESAAQPVQQEMQQEAPG